MHKCARALLSLKCSSDPFCAKFLTEYINCFKDKEEEEDTDFDDFDDFNDVTAIINKFPVLDC